MSNKKTRVECKHCSKSYDIAKRYLNGKSKPKYGNFCSKECFWLWIKEAKRTTPEIRLGGRKKGDPIECENPNCGKKFSPRHRTVGSKNNKRARKYCSQRCANICTKNHIGSEVRKRSAGEKHLYKYLRAKYPEDAIETNVYYPLDNLYEIDIYFPNKKFGIEWNGPGHYFPIYGKEAFVRTCRADEEKQRIANEKGIQILVIIQPGSLSGKKLEHYMPEAERIVTEVLDALEEHSQESR